MTNIQSIKTIYFVKFENVYFSYFRIIEYIINSKISQGGVEFKGRFIGEVRNFDRGFLSISVKKSPVVCKTTGLFFIQFLLQLLQLDQKGY